MRRGAMTLIALARDVHGLSNPRVTPEERCKSGKMWRNLTHKLPTTFLTYQDLKSQTLIEHYKERWQRATTKSTAAVDMMRPARPSIKVKY